MAKASGSLSRRILSVALLLLVIPLFLQALFLYWQEYELYTQEVQTDLKILSDERGRLIEEMIQTRWAILDSPLSTVQDDPYCESQESVFVQAYVKQLYIQKIPLPPGQAEYFVIPNKNGQALYVGKRTGLNSANVIAIAFSEIAQGLGEYRVALLDRQGRILEESQKSNHPESVVEITKPIEATQLKLQLSIDESQVQKAHLSHYLFHFVTLVFFVGGLGGTLVYLFVRRINRPLRHLSQTMEKVAEGADHVRYTPDRMGFEINQLGIQLNGTLDALFQHAQEVQKERARRERLAEELRIGHEIQASLVPVGVPGLKSVDIGVGYSAAKEVSGDFYDLFPLDDGRLLIVICDTAGKGVSACLFSLGLRSIFRSLASSTQDLSEIVLKANDLYFIDAQKSAMFSTAWIGIYDPKKRQLDYCNQGHPPPILKRKNKLQELSTEGIVMGAQKFDAVSTKTEVLKKEDLIFLYTDGIVEAHNLDQQLFGKDSLQAFILRQKKETAQQIADQLMQEVQAFSQGASQHDDITLVVLSLSY